MEKSVFDFTDYKRYLVHRAGGNRARRGVKQAIARAIRCQPTYVSQVFNGSAHFSLEQAIVLNRFFGHSREEGQYFLLLVQKDRAGSRELEDHFREQVDEMLRRRLDLSHRLGARKVVSAEDQSIYYSSWHYAAIHIALTIPELRTREALARYLGLPVRKVTEALEFLVSAGLARAQDRQFVTGESHVRLGKDSHSLLKHHSNWRAQSIVALDREEIPDLHYSAVVSLSRRDVLKVKNAILEALDSQLRTIRESKEEELYAYNIDFFSLKRES